MTWTRVKDNDTKHEYSVQVVTDSMTVIDKPATNGAGDPLPPKQHIDLPRSDSGSPLGDMTVAELTEYASTHQVDLDGASKKAEIVHRITQSA